MIPSLKARPDWGPETFEKGQCYTWDEYFSLAHDYFARKVSLWNHHLIVFIEGRIWSWYFMEIFLDFHCFLNITLANYFSETFGFIIVGRCKIHVFFFSTIFTNYSDFKRLPRWFIRRWLILFSRQLLKCSKNWLKIL